MHLTVPPFTLPLLLLAGSPCLADSAVVREHHFGLAGIDTLELRSNAGSIEIEPADGADLEVLLRIESKQDGWFRRAPDVSGLDLLHRERNGRLVLEQTAEETESHWVLRLPAVATTRLDLGIGSISGDLPVTHVDIRLGVGEVDLEFPGQAAGEMRLKVGVGDAGIEGAADIRASRNFVSQEINATGHGEQDIDIDVGVGNIALRLL